MCNKLSERRIKYFEEMKNKDKAIRATSAFWPEKSKRDLSKIGVDDVVYIKDRGDDCIGLVIYECGDGHYAVTVNKGGWFVFRKENELIKIGEI